MARSTSDEGVTERCRWFAAWMLLCLGVQSLAGCGSGEAGASAVPVNPAAVSGNVRVSWTANREAAVNRAGGGYRVYYGTVAGFSISTAPFVDVPYAGGATAPTSAGLSLPPGTHFIKVVAYSSLNPSGSEPSTEVTVTVPSASAGVARAP